VSVVEGLGAIVVAQGEDPRKIIVSTVLSSGATVATDFFVPMVIYRGVFRAGGSYVKGDNVTFRGSSWIALVDCPDKMPGDPMDGKDGTPQQWQLAVKRGSEGKRS
jgi:integrin beta 3